MFELPPFGGYDENMDKRLAKRHKRQVARAKEHVKLSEPDLRTPEQIKAAREASRPDVGHSDVNVGKSTPAFRGSQARGTGSAAKTDG
jgi:hypothetical protein